MQNVNTDTYYAYKIALPDAPEGYYPVGTRSEMIAVYNKLAEIACALDSDSDTINQLNKSQARVISDMLNEGVDVFKLAESPSPLKPHLNMQSISKEAKSLIEKAMTADEFCIPTGSVRKKIEGVVSKFKPAVANGQDTLKRVRQGESVDPMQLLFAATSAFSGVADIRAEYNNALSTLVGKFGASSGGEFIKNSQGLFVNEDWLSKPENATRIYKLHPAKAKEQSMSAPAPR